MRRVVGVVVALLIAVGGCGSDNRYLPAGSYAGSTATEQPFTIDSADKPKVDGKKAEWEGYGELHAVGLKGKPRLRCRMTVEDREMRCTVRWAPGVVETIELVRV